MAPRRHFLFVIFISCVIHFVPTVGGNSLNGRKVLLVSMDGFRHDYLKKAKTPNFDAFIKSGATVPYVDPIFVPVAFPSHHSIATGLYADYHGIVANTFYDPVLKETFKFTSIETKWWNASEPIWINAVKSGLKVGTFFWPGNDVDFDGYRPLAGRTFIGGVPFDTRIKTVVDWLAMMDFDLCMLYFEEPDESGHSLGPDDPRFVQVIERMDSTLGLIMTSLEKAGIKGKVDVIVTSDHGMATVKHDKQILDFGKEVKIRSLTDKTLYTYGGSMVHLFPIAGKTKELLEALSKLKHLNVFLRKDIPKRFNYGNNRRISDIFAYADEGWDAVNYQPQSGIHGFDNDLMSMKTIFIASGPSFKEGYCLPKPIQSVDIYPLLCHLLNLKPAPNNGSFQRIRPVLNGCPDVPLTSPLSFAVASLWLICAHL